MYRVWTKTDYQKWLKHVQRMEKNRLPKVATTYTEDGQNRLPNEATTYREDGQKPTNKFGYNMYKVWTQTD